MPAASWRTSPARTMSLWLMASASAGSSRSVGMSDRDQRMRDLLGAGDLVRSGHSGLVEQPLHRRTADDVGVQDLLEVGLLDAAIPDVVRIHDDHRPVAALREAPRLVDADLGLLPGGQGAGPERLHELLDVSLGGTGFP